MKNNAKIIGMILGVCLFIVLISSVTYAIYTWSTNGLENIIIEGTSNCFEIVYTKGDDIGSDGNIKVIKLGSSYIDGYETTIKIKLDDSCNSVDSGVGTIYLNTTEISDILKNDNLINFNYQVLEDGTAMSAGRVSDVGTIPIYEDFTVTTIEKSITVYFWVNGEYVNEDNAEEVLAAVYNGNITAKVESR